MSEKEPRWTEIEHLPEWDEEFYHIYTARKLGKWVMMKTLRPELADIPEYRQMIEREFDVRYNLAHPNIVMINDFEDVPGVGRCIITDDVYGDSLRKLIDQGRLNRHHLYQLTHQLPEALEYIQANHIVHQPLRPENIIFTENIGNLKLIDVGFDQRKSLTAQDTRKDIADYGRVLTEVLDAMDNHDPLLRTVARRCQDPNTRHPYRNVQALQMALHDKTNRWMYILILTFLGIMILLLAWLLSPYRPTPPVQ